MKESQIMLTREDFGVILDGLTVLVKHLPPGTRRKQVGELGQNITRALIEDEKKAMFEEGYVPSPVQTKFDAIPQSKKDDIVVRAAEEALKEMDDYEKQIVMAIAEKLAENKARQIQSQRPDMSLAKETQMSVVAITNNNKIDEMKKRVDEWFEGMKS